MNDYILDEYIEPTHIYRGGHDIRWKTREEELIFQKRLAQQAIKRFSKKIAAIDEELNKIRNGK